MNMFKYNILRSPGPGYDEGSGGLGFTSTPATQSSTSPAPGFGTTVATLPGVNITTAYISHESGASSIAAFSGYAQRPNTFPIRDRGSSSNGELSTPYVSTVFAEHCQPVYVQEKHLTVIRKGPTMPPTLEMFAYVRADLREH